jgi:hypothetical protein
VNPAIAATALAHTYGEPTSDGLMTVHLIVWARPDLEAS